MKKAPCKDCENRKVGCHAHCEKYLEYKQEREAIYKQREQSVGSLTPNASKQKFINRKSRRLQNGYQHY